MKKIIFAISSLFLLLGLWFSWQTWMRPTRIALINFSDFQLSRMASSNQSRWIHLTALTFQDSSQKDLSDYDFILVWSHGKPLTESTTHALQNAIQEGVSVYCQGATSTENDLTAISTEHLKNVESYLNYGGSENYQQLYLYIRHQIQKSKFFSPQPLSPQAIASDVFFHLNETYFSSVSAYQTFRKQQGLEKPGAPRIALFTSNLGPRNSGRGDIDSLIMALEREGLNVYPVDGFYHRLEMLDSINPQLVISQPHGRFLFGRDQETIRYFKQRNIPLLTPIKVFQPYQNWLDDQRGMDGGSLGQSIVVPELDGAIEPFVTAAQFKNDHGFYDFQEIPGRTQRLARRVKKWLNLQSKPNSQKKISIMYLKGPGQNALVAGGLEVLPSLYAFLLKLQTAGYNVDGLPGSMEEFTRIVHQKGLIPGPYAKGTITKLIQEGNPEHVPADLYQQWAGQTLDSSLWKSVLDHYGPAPGPYLSVQDSQENSILVTRIVFGNIALLPQPLPGYGENEFNLIHGTHQAPPHPYIAAYLWTSQGFQSDALIHFGTHGSFEFLPSKQVALSEKDWPDALIGDMPHGYVYVINNIGEAMMAKRRGYATMLSHLTPPFMSSGLYDDLLTLHNKLHHYLLPNIDKSIQKQYALSIKEIVIQLGLDKDLSFKSLAPRELTSEEINRLHNHLHQIEQEKTGKGLYTLGTPYTDAEACTTSTLMHIDVLAFAMAELDILYQKEDHTILENKHLFEEKYRKQANQMIHQALQGKNVLKQILSTQDLKRISLYEASQTKSRHSTASDSKSATSKTDSVSITPILLQIAANPEMSAFIKKWDSDREYQRIQKLLDPSVRSRFNAIAKMVPEMQAISTALDFPHMTQLIRMASDSSNRKIILNLLKDSTILAQLRAQKQKQKDSLHVLLTSDSCSLFLQTVTDSSQKISQDTVYLRSAQNILETALNHTDFLHPEWKSRQNLLQKAKQKIISQLTEVRERENQIRHHILTIQNTLEMVSQSRNDLLVSTETELNSILHFLNGQYIPPSSGGDPISNPASVPTGKNLYAINAESTPTREAWQNAQKMVDALLKQEQLSQGKYPQKIALSLWGGEFVRDQGTTLAQAFYLLGVEPVWNSRGRMYDVKLIPSSRLKRSRIDVVVQTSGQFRDLGASRLYLLNKAVQLASEAPQEENGYPNFVHQGTRLVEKKLLQQGDLSPQRIAKISRIRVFGGLNGNYGTGIMGLVEAGDQWQNEKQIQQVYLKNMGAMYDQDEWGTYEKGFFAAALQNTEIVLHSRSSNTTGPLSLDHTYEFMGGLTSAIRGVTGKDPRAFFTDTRNRMNPVLQDAREAVWVEARTSLLNPKYVQEMMQEGETAAENFAEVFRNTYGWEVMKPELIDDKLWESYRDMFIEDTYQLGVREFFVQKNPFAYQEMTAVMLETIRKGYWKASQQTIRKIADIHAQWVHEKGAGCSGFVCNNAALQTFIKQNLTSSQQQQNYSQAIQKARENQKNKHVLHMEKKESVLPFQSQPKRIAVLWVLAGAILLGLTTFLWQKRKHKRNR